MLFHASRFIAPGFLIVALMLAGCAEDKSTVEAPVSDADALIADGGKKSRMCMGCHGPNGISRVASYPSIAGLSETYIAEQLNAFRSGARENPMMSSISMSLSDKDILALAAYYASQTNPANTEGAVQPESQQ